MSGFCAFLCIDFFARNTLTVSEFDAQIHRRIMPMSFLRSVLMGMDI